MKQTNVHKVLAQFQEALQGQRRPLFVRDLEPMRHSLPVFKLINLSSPSACWDLNMAIPQEHMHGPYHECSSGGPLVEVMTCSANEKKITNGCLRVEG